MARRFDPNAAFIPGYGYYLVMKNMIHNIKTNGFNWKDLNGFWKEEEEVQDSSYDDATQTLLGEITANSRQEFLDDRAHTEAREDSSVQRLAQDYIKAGLNPYSISASPSNSSTSSVGQNSIASKLQLLGYLLDIKNLDYKNKQVINQTIGNVIRFVR